MKITRTILALLAAGALFAAVAANAAEAEKKDTAQAKPKKTIAIVVAENEYKAETTMPAFGKMLAEKYGFACEYAIGTSDDKDPKRFTIPNIEKVKNADLVMLFARRRPLPPEQMAFIREHLKTGKPLVAIRTASHAFALRKADDPAGKGLDQWATFDKEVLGCNYQNHYGETKEGTAVTIVDEKKDHPILTGVTGFTSPGSLYRVMPLAPTAQALMMGKIEGQDAEPVLITNTYINNGRIVYTSLGHAGDFEIPAFRRMLVNATFWALGLDVPKE